MTRTWLCTSKIEDFDDNLITHVFREHTWHRSVETEPPSDELRSVECRPDEEGAASKVKSGIVEFAFARSEPLHYVVGVHYDLSLWNSPKPWKAPEPEVAS